MAIYLISDTHFYHHNIIASTGRPFTSVNHMNGMLIANWNMTVLPGDTVYHLGDVGLSRQHDLPALIAILHGEKHLILGNHDREAHAASWWRDCGFVQVYEEAICLGDGVWLSHEPLMDAQGGVVSINIHGHTHDKTAAEVDARCRNTGIRYLNACVEVQDYKPFGYAEKTSSVTS